MTEAQIINLAWSLIEEYGPELHNLLTGIIDSLTPTEGVTHCGICGTESPLHLIVVSGKKVFRGKCPTHGFKR